MLTKAEESLRASSSFYAAVCAFHNAYCSVNGVPAEPMIWQLQSVTCNWHAVKRGCDNARRALQGSDADQETIIGLANVLSLAAHIAERKMRNDDAD
mgnify:CR=1 FL=1